jgi:thymidylate kinase
MKEKGQRVALIGLDGSGKSANINKMKTDADYSDYKFVWVRWEPTLLKPAYWILSKKMVQNKVIKAPVDGKTGEVQEKLNADYHAKLGMKEKIFKNSFIRSIWMFLALTDYFVQFYIKTAGMILRKDNLVFDRFYLDLFVDQGINFGYTPEQIKQGISKNSWLFPNIDKIIYIKVSPETCYKRKDDIPNMDYLYRRYDIYECLAEQKGWVSIDGEQPFEMVNKTIKQEILG